MNEVSYKLGVAVCEDFNKVYPEINKQMLENANSQESRNGGTIERLNFKTEISEPTKRCVAGYNRNINVFFLLAEAMWIWVGRKDVKFLTEFNKGMSNFSDDGENFHAPYGFRMRHHGVNSFDKHSEENKHFSQGFDQFPEALLMLAGKGKRGDGKDTRATVLQIWNADLDLNVKTKDLPCNDLFMLQHRNNKLHGTIANRSNDLHWGVPTNVFQFSFILEAFSLILGYEVGTQCHNSKSLHIYKDNSIAYNMYNSDNEFDLYSKVNPSNIDFSFRSHDDIESRLSDFDRVISKCISFLEGKKQYTSDEKIILFGESIWLKKSVDFLMTYIEYKREMKNCETDYSKDFCRMNAFEKIYKIYDGEYDIIKDMLILGMNFFYKRIKQPTAEFEAKYGDFIKEFNLGNL